MNINRYTKIFIKNIMLGLGNVHLSLLNKCQVYKVLEKAYIAMSPRTFDKLRDDAEIDSAKKKEVLYELAQKFVDYFKALAPTNQAEFDKWHKDTCDWFVKEFNVRVMRPSGYKDIEYGKVAEGEMTGISGNDIAEKIKILESDIDYLLRFAIFNSLCIV